MIAYAFPPTGGSGVQRSAKFAKYLPQHGWLPTVWTVDGADGLPRDETLCYDLPPEVTVCANTRCGGVRSIRRSLRGFANARTGEGLSGVASRFAKAVDWRLENWVSSNCFPDDCIAWARQSLGTLRTRLASENFDVLYSTYSPASNHWLALELKRGSGIPWVAFFRDLWTEDCRYRADSPARQAAHRRLEQEILETADVVIGVSPRQTEILAGHVPNQSEKFLTITNGFDPEDFTHVPRGGKTLGERFSLTYVGRFDLSQTPESWFTALRKFVEEIGPDRDRFVLRIAGHVNRTAQAKLTATGVRCEIQGYLPHREAISAMCQADALLLCSPSGPNGDTIIPAKLFEYLATGRPILTVGPSDSICERMVRSARAGVCADFEEASIGRALHEVFGAWRRGTPMEGAWRDGIEDFSRVRLTGKLSGVFDQIAVARPEGSLTRGELVAACDL